MGSEPDSGTQNRVASSPCLADDLQRGQDGSYYAVDPQQSVEVARWRKAERTRLLGMRKALGVAERNLLDEKIIGHVSELLNRPGQIVSFYWPFRGEPDLRPLIGPLSDAGVTCALPVVIEKHAPLVFRQYKPGDRLEAGVWNIPVPAIGEEVVPDVLLGPVVGFDPHGFRLGYGGGFFDRTMAARNPEPRLIGIGYEIARVPTIFPQPHDRPADMVVTEAGMFERNA